jgi:phosphoribosylformylglycinamidine cyclo-ligase
MAGVFDTVGADIVNHSINDLLCTGAQPLFFLDYLAFSKLDADKVAKIVEGAAKACRKEGVALIGGETAQLPGVYKPGEYDLVGTIVGAIEEGKLIDGKEIKEGDVAIGLRSTGLHTNGYSLARKVLLEGNAPIPLDALVPGTKKTVGQALLAVHRSYRKEVERVLPLLKGVAHITGGGFQGNVSRLLPGNVDCVIEKKSWKPQPIFRLIQIRGQVAEDEMYHVFNMGIGMVLFVRPNDAEETIKSTRGIIIGRIEKGKGRVNLA